MRRVSRITVAGAATASLARALTACGGTSAEAESAESAGSAGSAGSADSGQYQGEALARYKDHVLNSATKDVAKAVYNLAKSVEDGKPGSGIVRGDLKTGEAGLADSNPGFKADTELQEAIETAKEKIVSGEIKVRTS